MLESQTIRVKPKSCQPAKAEVGKSVVLLKPDGSLSTPGELPQIALQQVEAVEDHEWDSSI